MGGLIVEDYSRPLREQHNYKFLEKYTIDGPAW